MEILMLYKNFSIKKSNIIKIFGLSLKFEKSNMYIKKKINMYIYILIFFFIFNYIFFNFTFIFEILFIFSSFNNLVSDYFYKMKNSFKEFLGLRYLKNFIYKYQLFLSNYFFEFFDLKRRLKYFKSSQMD